MIGIIDYNSGNIASVKNALDKLGFVNSLVSDPCELNNCSKVVFPGVGRAGSAMREIKKRNFDKAIKELKIPFLGICLGMQLLSDYSEEDDTACLGIIPGQVKKFSNSLKVPQIGWNKVKFLKNSPLFEGIETDEYFYFVNSFYFEGDGSSVAGRSLYGGSYASVLAQDNFFATQFHPEKSGEVGLKLLRNFCELC